MVKFTSIWSKTNAGDFKIHNLNDRKLKDKKLKNILDVIYLQQLNINNSEQLPHESTVDEHLVNGFLPGSSLLIYGFIQQNVDRLTFNLCNYEDEDDDDIVFHFNPRFHDNEIVRNTCKDGEWGEEETSGGLPLIAGANFSLKINCEKNGFDVYINEKMFGFYEHRIKPKKITHFEVEGAMTLNLVLYKTIIDDEDDLEKPASSSSGGTPAQLGFSAGAPSVPTSIWAGSDDALFPVYNPYHGLPNEFYNGIHLRQMKLDDEFPMKIKFDKNFTPGSSVIIHGLIPSDTDRVDFNLWSVDKSGGDKKKDIALHFNPRFDEGEIVRNTFVDDYFGDEERFGGFPLKFDTNFSLEINCEQDGYRIFIDDKEFTFYCHRISPTHVKKLEIVGEMVVHSIFYKTI